MWEEIALKGNGYYFIPVTKKTLSVLAAEKETVTFGLGYRKDSPKIDIATQPYSGRWTHHVMAGGLNEIDEELLAADITYGDFFRKAPMLNPRKRESQVLSAA